MPLCYQCEKRAGVLGKNKIRLLKCPTYYSTVVIFGIQWWHVLNICRTNIPFVQVSMAHDQKYHAWQSPGHVDSGIWCGINSTSRFSTDPADMSLKLDPVVSQRPFGRIRKCSCRISILGNLNVPIFWILRNKSSSCAWVGPRRWYTNAPSKRKDYSFAKKGTPKRFRMWWKIMAHNITSVWNPSAKARRTRRSVQAQHINTAETPSEQIEDRNRLCVNIWLSK